MGQKDLEIINLSFTVDRKNEELKKIDEIVAERVKVMRKKLDEEMEEVVEEYQEKGKKLESEFKVMRQEVESERMVFTTNMYREFSEMRQCHEEEVYSLTYKYAELEKLFEERPSREEDLSKIKELIEEKTKMNAEVKICQKKVKEANEIVRYLNLELENYKDTYDIFGPTDDPLSPLRKNKPDN